MKDFVEDIAALDHGHARFMDMLTDQYTMVAVHTLQAWEGKTLADINSNLDATKVLLQQIASTAGAQGFADLRASAHSCAANVIAHLEGPDADLAICLAKIVHQMDGFVGECRHLLDTQG